MLAAGAAGAWIGTALLACPEALTDAQARARILAAGETGTVYTRVFDVALRIGWPPEYGGRALANEFSRRWTGREDELAAAGGAREELSAARKRGDYDIAYQYAGQGVGLVREERPAAEVVAGLAAGCRAAAAQPGMTMADCRFDAILAGDAPAWFVLDEPEVVGFLDVRPLFKGHVLVVPREHHETLADLPAALVEPLFGWVQRISAAMPAAYGAQGSFVAINNTVSQSVPHLHVHVVPRTKGDGLRGFFWPRGRYADDDEAEQYARRMRDTRAGVSDAR